MQFKTLVNNILNETVNMPEPFLNGPELYYFSVMSTTRQVKFNDYTPLKSVPFINNFTLIGNRNGEWAHYIINDLPNSYDPYTTSEVYKWFKEVSQHVNSYEINYNDNARHKRHLNNELINNIKANIDALASLPGEWYVTNHYNGVTNIWKILDTKAARLQHVDKIAKQQHIPMDIGGL